MYYVYILKSVKNGRLYTGSTANIERRLMEHNNGHSKATKSIRPFVLVHQESYSSRSQAYQRELYLKTGKGRAEIKIIMGSSYNG